MQRFWASSSKWPPEICFEKNPSGRKKTFYVSFLLVTNFRFVFIKAGKKCQKQLVFFLLQVLEARERERESERDCARVCVSEWERERETFYWSCFCAIFCIIILCQVITLRPNGLSKGYKKCKYLEPEASCCLSLLCSFKVHWSCSSLESWVKIKPFILFRISTGGMKISFLSWKTNAHPHFYPSSTAFENLTSGVRALAFPIYAMTLNKIGFFSFRWQHLSQL